MRTRHFLILTFLFTLFLSIGAISAANVTINPGDSIQDAIDNAASGDTIIMNSGTYTQSGIQINKELTLTGATNNFDDVIIDAQKNDRVIEVSEGVNNVKLQGLTITNGITSGFPDNRGAGILNKGGTQDQPTQIINCKFTNNNATFEGGAIMNYGNLTLVNCTLFNNTAGGNGGGMSNSGNLTVTGSNIQQNTAPTSMGGGICNWDTMIIIESIIQQNQALLGGGILNGGELTITDSTIQQNQGINGGGIDNFETLNISGSIIQDNTAPYGAGIMTFNDLRVTDCIIQDNTATGTNSMGGGIFNFAGTSIITESTLQRNTAEIGGGICNFETLTITGSTILQNTAIIGGAIFNNQSGTLTANFNRIVENTPNAIECRSGSVNALYNWWGSNNPDFATLVNGSVTYDPWLVMRYSANPTTIKQGQTSNLVADFRYDSNGVFHDPAAGHLPDGTLVTFTTTLGNVGSKSVVIGTINGVATAILRGNEAAGKALTSATLDSQTLMANVTITKVASNNTVNAQSVGMQTTGMPIAPLVFAVLSVLGGFTATRKKQ